MVDLDSYIILLVEEEGKIKLYGSASERNDCDEIIEINSCSLEDVSYEKIIKHIHQCIKTRTICLRVKRKPSNNLGNLVTNSSLIDAFIIGFNARKHLQKFIKNTNITPKDITQLSNLLSDEINSSQKESDNNPSVESKKLKNNVCENTGYFELNNNNMQFLNINPRHNKLKKSDSQSSLLDVAKQFTNIDLNNTLNENNKFNSFIENEHLNISSSDLKSILSKIENQIDDKKIIKLMKKINFKSLLDIYSNLIFDNHYHNFTFEINTIQLVQDVVNLIKDKVNIDNDMSELLRIFTDLKFKGVCTVFDYLLNKSNFFLSSNYQNENYKDHDVNLKSENSRINLVFTENKCCEKVNSGQNSDHEPPPVPPLPNSQLLYSFEIDNISQNNNLSNSTCLNKNVQPSQNIQIKYIDQTSDLLELSQNSNKSNLQCKTNESLLDCVSEEKSNTQNKNFLNTLFAQESTIFKNNYIDSINPSQNILLYLNQNFTPIDFSENYQNPLLKPISEPSLLVPNIISTVFPKVQSLNHTSNSINTDLNGKNYNNVILPIPSVMNCSNLNTTLPSYLNNLPTDIPENTKLSIVSIEKHSSEPLGATVRNEVDGRVTIGRIICGGAAEKCTALEEGDEILMVNNINMRGKNVDQVCELLSQMQGTLTFVIAKQEKNLATKENYKLQDNNKNIKYNRKARHFKAYFDYNPNEDIYIPCCELGVAFKKGDLLHVLDSSDDNWWQAYREGDSNQNLAGLIPSLKFQMLREEVLKKEALQNSKKRREEYEEELEECLSNKKSLFYCNKKAHLKKKKNRKEDTILDNYYIPYEEMKQDIKHKRTIVLVGPNNIGRQYLREKLLKQKINFGTAIPHTSRNKRNEEENGIDYHFVSKLQFEALIEENKFLEYGDYDKTYYGTAFSSIEDVIKTNKTCILNLHVQSIHKLRTPETGAKFKPYFVFIAPPIQLDELQKLVESVNHVQVSSNELNSILNEAWEIKKNYLHYFDLILTVKNIEETFKILLNEINSLNKEPQWMPVSWL